MNDHSDKQIGREKLASSNDYEEVIRKQSDRIRQAAINAYIREHYTNVAFHGELDWIKDIFEDLSRIPHPRHSQAMADSVAVVSGSAPVDASDDDSPDNAGSDATGGLLGDRATDGHANIRDAVRGWQGEAAHSFRNNFLKDIPSTIRNQTALATVLRDTATANAGLLLAARKDSQELALKAKEILDAFDPGGGVDVATGFAVVAAAATIAAGIATIPTGGGAPLAAAGFTILAGIGSAASLAADKHEPMSLGADTVDGILDNIYQAYKKIRDELWDGWDSLTLKVLSPNIQATGNEIDAFVPSRPQITGKDPDYLRDNFRPPEV